MKTSDILQAFHGMPACDRLDLLCRMLHYCVPYEAHFLGTVLVDTSREHYKSFVNKAEVSANRVNYYSGFKDMGLTHDVCEKLCCALAVVHADNHPVAEVVFNLLNDPKILKQMDELKDVKVMQDFRLLYVMGVHHPAFTFNQRQLLLYTYLQQMDTMFAEKAKFGFSLSNSMEKTLTSEGGESGRYPPEGLKEPAPDAYITRCEVHSVYKRLSDKRYVYMILVEWSDGTQYTIRRTYGDFFSFQTKLLDLFPEEGGQKGKKHPRLIPFLPGKNYSRFLKNKEVAEKRLPELHRYSKELMSLPERITRFPHVLEFFKPRPSDEKDEYPPLHKITNLYDLIDAGKTRIRVQSEPGIRGSPTHSPMISHHHHHNQGCDSPLHRAVPTATTGTTTPITIGSQQPNGYVDNPSPRTARTLPPAPVSSSQVNSDDSCSPTVIPRRPTYPLSHKLKKSENSAFTPIGVSALSEDDLASTATLVASQVSIPHAFTPASTDDTTSPSSSSKSSTLTAAGGTSSIYSTAMKTTATTGQSSASAVADGVGVALSSTSSEGGGGGGRRGGTPSNYGRHVQPVATVPSHSPCSSSTATLMASTSTSCTTSANTCSDSAAYASTSRGSVGSSGERREGGDGGGVQTLTNHVGANLSGEGQGQGEGVAMDAHHHHHPADGHYHSPYYHVSASNGSSTAAAAASSDAVVLISPPTISSSELSISNSEAHTLTRTHPNVANSEESGEVMSPGLNMEGGSSAYIDTVNQSYLAYAQPLPPGSIIQGSPHHQLPTHPHHHSQYLQHAAFVQQVVPPAAPAQHAKSYLHNQTSPTSVVTSSIVSSNISPSPTLSETSNQSGGIPFSPGLLQYAPYSPISQMFPRMSPLHSPVPPGKRAGNRRAYHSSNVSVNRMPTESDTLLAWLKSLRLHKYYSKFENTTFEEMCSLTVDMMKEKGLTEGAAKKLHKKLEELRSNNFGGFSGMPIAPGMIRKPSTCSLPASLLMEQQGMTPSSSIEGLSPTGSTCSLGGMVGHSHHHTPHHQQQQVRRTPTPSHSSSSSRHSAVSHTPHSTSAVAEQGRQPIKSESSAMKGERSSVAVVDSAIVKAGPSFHSPPLTSPASPDSVTSSSSRMDSSFLSEDASIGGNDSSENPLRGVSSRSSATIVRGHPAASSGEKEKPTSRQPSSESGAVKVNGPVHAPNTAATGSNSSKGDREELTSSWKSVGNVSNCSSNWADEAVSSVEAANINRPDWANMSPPNSANNNSSNSSSAGSGRRTVAGGSTSSSSTPINVTRQHTTPSTNGSSSGDSSSNSGGGAGHHHHHHKSQHSHHHQRQSTPSSSSRTVHQIHSSNSLSDIIPIQTHPGHSSPFHSPPSSTSSSSSASFTSPPSSISSGPTPPSSSSSKSSNSQRPTTESHSHPLPTSASNTSISSPSTISSSTTHSAAKHKQSHTPLVKRNSSELSANQSSPVLQAAPPPPPQQVYVGGNRAPNIVGVPAGRGAGGVGVGVGVGAGGGHNWIMRPVLLPNHPVTVIGVPVTGRNQHQHQVIHTSNPPVTIPHNGLMRTVPGQQNRLPPGNTATIVPATFVPTHYHHHHQPGGGGGGGGGLVVCPPASISHIQGGSGGPPAMCFNCGKRGHLGNSCPGVTMETNNPDNFHKKVEKHVSAKRSS